MDLFDFLLLGIALINLIACPIVALCLAASNRQNRALHERNAAQAAMIYHLEWPMGVGEPPETGEVKRTDFWDGVRWPEAKNDWEGETREFEPVAPLELNRIRGADVADLGRKMTDKPLGQILREGEDFMTNRLRVEHASIEDNYSGHPINEQRADCPICTRQVQSAQNRADNCGEE